MARRRIGQEQLVLDGGSGRSGSSLGQMAALIDWTQIDRQLDEIYRSPRGEAGWPPLSLFKGMLLAMWHDLSDVKLEEALADRASFRRSVALQRVSRRRSGLASCASCRAGKARVGPVIV